MFLKKYAVMKYINIMGFVMGVRREDKWKVSGQHFFDFVSFFFFIGDIYNLTASYIVIKYVFKFLWDEIQLGISIRRKKFYCSL